MNSHIQIKGTLVFRSSARPIWSSKIWAQFCRPNQQISQCNAWSGSLALSKKSTRMTPCSAIMAHLYCCIGHTDHVEKIKESQFVCYSTAMQLAHDDSLPWDLDLKLKLTLRLNLIPDRIQSCIKSQLQHHSNLQVKLVQICMHNWSWNSDLIKAMWDWRLTLNVTPS